MAIPITAPLCECKGSTRVKSIRRPRNMRALSMYHTWEWDSCSHWRYYQDFYPWQQFYRSNARTIKSGAKHAQKDCWRGPLFVQLQHPSVCGLLVGRPRITLQFRHNVSVLYHFLHLYSSYQLDLSNLTTQSSLVDCLPPPLSLQHYCQYAGVAHHGASHWTSVRL
jgi:hypothetical protein